MAIANKGYDDSPPRNGVILFYTVLAVVVLIGVDFLLDSYFAKVMDTEIHDKVLTVGLDKAIETKQREQQELEKAGISQAMRAIAQSGRGASPNIAPTSGAGQPAVGGWSQLKRQAPPAAAAAEPTRAANASPQPANPNAQHVDPQPAGTGGPENSKSPVAPGNRSGGTAGDAR
jgi:hypothetical protein